MYRKNISGGIKTVILIVLVSSLMTLVIPEIYGQEDSSSSGVEFLEVNVEPANILVGDNIMINATIINNSDNLITFQAGCDSPIWLEFLSEHVELALEPACQSLGGVQLEPGQQQKVMGPGGGILYKAISAGTLEAEVFFSYGIGKSFVPSITISKTIVIQINSEKEIPIVSEIPSKSNGEKREIPIVSEIPSKSNGEKREIPIVSEIPSKSNGEKREIPPHKQVSSGTNPEDVICSEGLKLIFKSTDNSPACVKPSSAEKLIQRGWTT